MQLLSRWTKKQLAPPITGALPVRSSSELLAPHRDRLAAIQQLVGVSPGHWDNLYLDLFHAFAAYVQSLPASEAHHHAGVGGLLSHALEVVVHALRLRRGHLIPPGAPPETLAVQHDLWTYATATAALLHDIGKPLASQRVALFDQSGAGLDAWEPCVGPIPAAAAWYRADFVRGQRYRLHEKVAPLLCHIVIPPSGLRWLASNPTVLAPWLAAITGDRSEAGILGQLVQQADRLSVADDLGGDQSRLPTTRATPLHERLLTGLRYLLDQGELPLNRKGAAGWLTGEDLWLVSKRALDRLREHLEQEGQSGVPPRNDRFMDELQQHGVLVANGDRAIWTVAITVENWSQQLTVLRFSASRIWSEDAARPREFDGAVTPVEAGSSTEGELRSSSDQPGPVTSPKDHCLDSGPARSVDETDGDKEPSRDDPSPPSPECDPSSGDPDGGEGASDDRDDHGVRFLEWLRDGLAAGRFPINVVSARIDVAQEGLLLVSPAIFKDFDPESWSQVQKRFQKLKLHLKTPRGTNIFTYRVQGPKKRGRLRVYLIPAPEQAFPETRLPAANPHLSLLE